MARDVQVSFDADDPHTLARWWAERLGLTIHVDSEQVEGLLAGGVISEEMVVRIDGDTFFADAVAAFDPDGRVPRFLFQRVPESKTAKNRLHLDIGVAQEELDDEVAAWTAIGAEFVEFNSHPGHRWAVMRDPEGNEFCLH